MTDKLAKAFEAKAFTDGTKPPWHELLNRFQTVPANRAVQAPEIMRGFAGSWAAMHTSDDGIRGDGRSEQPSPRIHDWKVGRPGVHELNFVPYNVGTNRFANKGPSYLGHPISMSVVGPTVKTSSPDWQWLVTDNSGTPGTGDRLTLDLVNSSRGAAVAPLVVTTISQGYGFANLDLFDGGLYLVITLTGAVANVDTTASNGVGDGYVLGAGINPLTPLTQDSRYELFRVVGMGTTYLDLAPNKRLADYFTIPGGTPALRAITLFEPWVTRLVALPSVNGRGKETSFVVVPPVETANSDLFPSNVEWAASPSYDYYGSQANVGASNYNDSVLTPIPKPIDRRTGRLMRQNNGAFLPVAAGLAEWWIEPLGHVPLVTDVGKIFRIYKGSKTGASGLTDQGFLPDDRTILREESILGYFEVVEADATGGLERYRLRRVAEIDPETSISTFGPNLSLVLDDLSVGDDFQFDFTVHEATSTIFSDVHLDMSKVASSRLDTIIDPEWVAPTSAKTGGAAMGTLGGRADKAIFDTSSSATDVANPGSLLDLGFRMVIYPAQEGTGARANTVRPVWGSPIGSRDVVLDPSISDSQFIDIDYSSGIVTLSHTAVSGSKVTPFGILATNDNPRGEVVLFAACVPFSRERGQRGSGVQIGRQDAGDTSGCGGGPVSSAVYGSRKPAPVLHLIEGVAQTLQGGVNITMELEVANIHLLDWTEGGGFFELRFGDEYGDPVFEGPAGEPLNVFGYRSFFKTNDTAGAFTKVRLTGVWGGPAVGSHVMTTPNEVVAVFRRDISLPINDTTGIVGVDYRDDLGYGWAKRSDVILFSDMATVPQVDGSLVVAPEDKETQSQELFQGLFSNWILDGGVVSGGITATLSVDVTDATVLIQGVRTVVKHARVALVPGAPADDPQYLYVDGTDPLCPLWGITNALPLPGVNDVLIARLDNDDVSVTNIVDMRSPLTDLDWRFDVLVGEAPGYPTPYFTELADAVNYVSELAAPIFSGTYGRHRRILVVGGTDEDTTKLPITFTGSLLGKKGLIIEGVHRNVDSPGDLAIKWTAEAPLFDLTGSSFLEFNNLNFFLDSLLPDSTVDPEAYTPFYTTGSVTETLITNCRLVGERKAHGFFWSTNTGVIQRCVFRDNSVDGCTDFGIAGHAGAQWQGNIIEGNRLDVPWGYKVVTPAVDFGYAVGIGLHPDTNAGGDSNRIQNNIITGPDVGMYLGIWKSHVTGNHITSTNLEGMIINVTNAISIDPKLSIMNNVFNSIHTSAAAVNRVCIRVSSGDNITIGANQLALTYSAAVDALIDAATSDGMVIHNNSSEERGKITVADGASFVGNILHHAFSEMRGLLNCIATGNNVGAFTLSDNSTASANIIRGSIASMGDNSTFTGNVVVSSGTKPAFGDTSTVVGNWIAGEINLVTSVGTVYTGNVIRGFDGNTLSGGIIQGNWITTTSLNVTGDDLIIVGNYVANDLLVTGNNAIVTDNIVVAGGLGIIGNGARVKGNEVRGIQSFAGTNQSLGIDGTTWIVEGNVLANSTTLGIGESGNECYGICNGNRFGRDVFLMGDYNAYCDNTHNDTANPDTGVSDLFVVGTSSRVHGNFIQNGDVTVQGTRCIVRGNHLMVTNATGAPGYMTVDSDEGVVSANHVWLDLTLGGSRSGYSVTGNHVSNDIIYTDGTDNPDAGNAGDSTFTGNVVLGIIQINLTDCILMGNHTTGIVNPGVTVAKPAGTIAVGNKLGAGTLFGAAAPVANDTNIA